MERGYVLGSNAARELKRLMSGSGEVSRRPSVASGLAFADDYALPFTVQWAQSVNDGAGAWIIWLPSDSLLVVDGEAVDLVETLTDAGGDYPEGWYQLECLDELTGGDLYLNVRIGRESGGDEGAAVTAEFAASPAEAVDGAVVYPLLVARCEGRTVRPNVSSAIALTGDGVTSLNDLVDDVDIIGGVGIEVKVEGQTIKISTNPKKDWEDVDPNDDRDPCADHPDGGSGGDGDDGAGGGGVEADGAEGSGGGCSNCGGESTVGGGSAAGGGGGSTGADGGIAPGAHGQESPGVDVPNGIESAGGSGSVGQSDDHGLFGGGGRPVEQTRDGVKSPLYGGAHSALTEANKMNQSPFVSGARKIGEGSSGPIYSGGGSPLYGDDHAQLTEANKMNQSPFKK